LNETRCSRFSAISSIVLLTSNLFAFARSSARMSSLFALWFLTETYLFWENFLDRVDDFVVRLEHLVDAFERHVDYVWGRCPFTMCLDDKN
jgi:hypothetical protein